MDDLTNNDIAAMSAAMNALDDDSPYVASNNSSDSESKITDMSIPVAGVSSDDIYAMGSIMESLSDLDEDSNVSYVVNNSTVSQSYNNVDNNFKLHENKVQGFKDTYSYDIEIAGKLIVEGMMMKEAAKALCDLLNDGYTLTDSNSLHLLGEGLRYTHLMEKAMKCKRNNLNENVNTESKKYLSEAKKCRSGVRNFLFDNDLI